MAAASNEVQRQGSKTRKKSHMMLLENLESCAAKDWSLDQDAQLTSLLYQFSIHMQKRTALVSESIQALEDQCARVAMTDVDAVTNDFLSASDLTFLRIGIVAPDDNEEHQDEASESSSSSHDEADEEDESIREGMLALSLFHDPQCCDDDDYEYYNNPTSDHYFGMTEEGPSAEYCYDAPPEDVFNYQRPLPFVVGSREFMESRDAGLGEEEYQEEEDEIIQGETITTTKRSQVQLQKQIDSERTNMHTPSVTSLSGIFPRSIVTVSGFENSKTNTQTNRIQDNTTATTESVLHSDHCKDAEADTISDQNDVLEQDGAQHAASKTLENLDVNADENVATGGDFKIETSIETPQDMVQMVHPLSDPETTDIVFSSSSNGRTITLSNEENGVTLTAGLDHVATDQVSSNPPL